MAVNAAPMMMPTAKSTTLPRMMKAWNSLTQPGARGRWMGACMASLLGMMRKPSAMAGRNARAAL